MRTKLLAVGLLLAGLPAVAETAPPRMSLDPANFDTAVQPCDDFYEHATGGWQKSHPIPASESRWGSFNVLADGNLQKMRDILTDLGAGKDDGVADFQKIGAFYRSCMDEAAIEKAGGTPIADTLKRIDAIHDKVGLNDEIRRLHAVGVDAFFGFGQEQDAKDPTRVIAQVQQGGLSLPNRDYYTRDDQRSKDLRQKFHDHVVKQMQLAGDTPARAAKIADTVLSIETALAKASKSPVELRDPQKNYNLVQAAELKSYAPSVDWDDYYKAVAVSPGALDLSQPEFLKGLEQVLTTVPLPDLVDYLRWHVVRANANQLSKAFVDEAFAFKQALTGAKELQPRWKRCVTATMNAMPDAVGKAFVEKAVPSDTKEKALKLVQNLRATLREDIQKLDWMGADTKKRAVEKLDAIAQQIVYPDVWRDYSKLEIASPLYAVNTDATRAFEVRRELSKIGKAPDRNDWQMSPMITNAYYEPYLNVIVFPAGILMSPFFDPKADDALNYGGIGAVIGHEMTHGFDDQGRQYDAKGKLTDWWTEEDGKRFDARAQCIIDQFDSYDLGDGVKMQGKLVTGEAIADLGGLSIAYRAFQKTEQAKAGKKIDGLTPDQRFFLNFANVWAANIRPEMVRLQANTDPHPIAKYRVDGTVSNLPQFGQAFQCKADNKMVRKQRCQIW